MSTDDKLVPLNKQKAIEGLTKELCSNFMLISFSERHILQHRERDAKLLSLILASGYVSREKIEEYVHGRLIALGVETFNEHRGPMKTAPDHCFGSHHALGYALKHGVVNAANIHFDHGETGEKYIGMAEGLLEDITNRLLTYKDPPKPIHRDTVYDDPHPACC